MIERNNWTWSQIQPLYRYVRQQAENKKFLKYLEIGATFSLIAIFLFLAIKPTASAISKLLGEIKSKELLISQMKTKINSVVTAQNSYSEAQEKYQIIESSLPDNPRFYQAASNLYGIANQSSINVDNLSFGLDTVNDVNKTKTKDNENVDSSFFTLRLNGYGSYLQSIDLIKKIINNRRLVDINNIQLDQISKKEIDQNPSLQNQLSISLSSNLFYSASQNEKK